VQNHILEGYAQARRQLAELEQNQGHNRAKRKQRSRRISLGNYRSRQSRRLGTRQIRNTTARTA
jgi:hypothetical protein